MNMLDYAIVAIYLCFTLGLGFYLRNQKSEGDFFLTPTALGGTKVLRAGISNQYTQKKNVLALVEALRKYLV